MDCGPEFILEIADAVERVSRDAITGKVRGSLEYFERGRGELCFWESSLYVQDGRVV